MNWKLIGTVGLKVLLAAGTGLAVFVGISKATGNVERKNQGSNNFGFSENDVKPEGVSNQVEQRSNELMNGLRATGEICGKLFAFVQSLTLVVENVGRIFGNGGNDYSQPYYNQNSWMAYGGYQGPQNMGNGLVRINPFIIEATGNRQY